jgi:hypothetical protein
LATQYGLEADGSLKLKKWLTHNRSHSFSNEKVLVNDRINMARYPDMYYGWCLIRIIHFIVCLRETANPEKRILIAKYDYSDPYHHVTHSARLAVQSILVLVGITYMVLRLPLVGVQTRHVSQPFWRPGRFCERAVVFELRPR